MSYGNKSSSKDNWLEKFEKTRNLVGEVIQNTTRRRQLVIGHNEYSFVSTSLKKLLIEANESLDYLVDDLDLLSSRELVSGEKERRLRLCESLKTSLHKASEEFRFGMAHSGPFTKVADLGTGNWNDGEETDVSREYSNSQLRDRQQTLLTDQNSALENLSTVVSSQKNIALAIQSEVDDQDELLIDISERVVDNRNHLEAQTTDIVATTRKSSTFLYWIVILGLLAAIIVVAVW